MATYQEIMDAARSADAAGDTEAASRLVKMAVAAKSQEQQSVMQPQANALPSTAAPVPAQTQLPVSQPQQQPTQPAYSTPKVIWTQNQSSYDPARAEAIKNFLKETGVEAGSSTLGQTVGLATGPFAPIAAPTFGAFGGLIGNLINQYTRERTGDFKVNTGEAISSFISGAIPGGNSIKFGGKAITKKVAPIVFDAAAAVASAETQSIIDNGRILTPQEAAMTITGAVVGSKIAGSLTDQNVAASVIAQRQVNSGIEKASAEAVKKGWVLWPSVTKKNAGRYYLEKVADPHKSTLDMARHNLSVIDKGVIDDLEMYVRQADGTSLPMPITKEAINLKRQNYEDEFSRIGQLTKTTDEILQIRGNRRRAASLYAQAESATDTVVKDKLRAEAAEFSDKAKSLEKVVDEASKLVSKNTYDRFVKVRKMFAQSFAVEDSLTQGGFRSGINPQKLSRWQDRKFGQELTDNLGFIAKMGDNFPDIVVGPDKLYSLERSMPKRTEGFTRTVTSAPSSILRQTVASPQSQRFFSGEQMRLVNPGIPSIMATQVSRAVGPYISSQNQPVQSP
jgi:hypothetical protein